MKLPSSALFCVLIGILGHTEIVLGSETTSYLQGEQVQASQSFPNFLILFADDLGYGDLAGTFGHPTSSTPNLKDLGKASKVFTNFYVTSPVCSPSR